MCSEEQGPHKVGRLMLSAVITTSPVSLAAEPSLQKPRTTAQSLLLQILRFSINPKVTGCLLRMIFHSLFLSNSSRQIICTSFFIVFHLLKKKELDIHLFGINQKKQGLTRRLILRAFCDLDGVRSARAGEGPRRGQR